ncbi:MAG: hypothetical protein ACOCRX_01855 [Candidatus Woesearchaeota archaeon]
MVKDEIEVKYLLYENKINYTQKDFFNIYNSLTDLINEVNMYGKKITQGYLNKNFCMEICKELNIDLNFRSAESRLRKKVNEYYFTIKGKGNIKRKELEKQIDYELFDKYFKKTNGKRVEKLRLEKKYKNYIIEIDHYIDRDLIVAEIEVDNQTELDFVPKLGKDIKDDRMYKNRNLAK